MTNVNTRNYWDQRYGQGDWERAGGYSQTRQFAQAFVPLVELDASFRGTICDFGCGAGDAMPVFRGAFPDARLVGIDFSKEAVDLARRRFGDIAEFVCGGVAETPGADIIVASNVMEHLSDDEAVVEDLLARCDAAYVIVPYRERIDSFAEHVRSYDRRSYSRLRPRRVQVVAVDGWSQQGKDLWLHIHLKNIARLCLGRATRRRSLQVLYAFEGRRGLRERPG